MHLRCKRSGMVFEARFSMHLILVVTFLSRAIRPRESADIGCSWQCAPLVGRTPTSARTCASPSTRTTTSQKEAWSCGGDPPLNRRLPLGHAQVPAPDRAYRPGRLTPVRRDMEVA